jgi:hypothetical protein
LQALSKQVKVLRKFNQQLSAGLDERFVLSEGPEVNSRPRSFLQIDSLPVNRFSGTVLEQVNTAIFEAFRRSPERFYLAGTLQFSSPNTLEAGSYGPAPPRKTAQ